MLSTYPLNISHVAVAVKMSMLMSGRCRSVSSFNAAPDPSSAAGAAAPAVAKSQQVRLPLPGTRKGQLGYFNLCLFTNVQTPKAHRSHVLIGIPASIPLLSDGRTFRTLSVNNLIVTVQNSNVSINGTNMPARDAISKNCVFYATDSSIS
jgi:hypothetical protein